MPSSINRLAPTRGDLASPNREIRENFNRAANDIEALQTAVAAVGGGAGLDPTISALANVTTAADELIYATGQDIFATTPFTALGRALAGASTPALARTTLGLTPAARVLYVDPAGDDANPGDLVTNPKQTITSALASAVPGDVIRIAAGTYTEACPMVVPRDVSIVGDGLRVVTVRPTTATSGNSMWLVDSGAYLTGMTFAGHQAGAWAVRFNAGADNSALGASGPGAFIFKSPYVQNCTSYTAQDDAGLAGSTSDGSTGGGILVDGAACAPNSPIRSMVVDSYTQINLDGPGCLVTNDAYAQLVSFFGTFCSFHVKAANGGQVNLSNSTTDFGIFGLIADGRSTTPIFTGIASAAASGTNQIAVTALTSNRLGASNRPASGMVFDVAGSTYTVVGSTPTAGGYDVTFYPLLTAALTGGETVSVYLRSQIATGGHTMEYVGAGTNYLALSWNGGVPIPGNEIVELNGGRVFFSTTDHLGNFRVGPQFDVDGTTGAVTINTSSFNISGLNFIGPFSRDGGFSSVGVQLREVSNNTSLLASTGAHDANTAPTQFAVVNYLQTNYVPQTRDLAAGTGLAGGGTLDANRTISLSSSSLASLALADASIQPGDAISSLVNDALFITAAQAPVQSVAGKTGAVTLTATDLTDFAESVDDRIAALLTAGSNIALSYDDAANTLTINASPPASGAGSGTVTSVDVSGGTTGLTTSGGPITASGTVTLAGTLAVAHGGTGATDAAGARAALGAAALGANTYSGAQNLADNALIRPLIRDYAEVRTAPTISSGTLTLNLETGNVFDVSLNANITTLTISNPPASGNAGSLTLILTADGTARTVTWPASIYWPGGTAPTLTSTSGKRDIIVLTTTDAGTNWLALVAGQNL